VAGLTFEMKAEKMATLFESVDFASISDDGQLTRKCPSPVRLELVSSKHETGLNIFNGKFS